MLHRILLLACLLLGTMASTPLGAAAYIGNIPAAVLEAEKERIAFERRWSETEWIILPKQIGTFVEDAWGRQLLEEKGRVCVIVNIDGEHFSFQLFEGDLTVRKKRRPAFEVVWSFTPTQQVVQPLRRTSFLRRRVRGSTAEWSAFLEKCGLPDELGQLR